MSDTDKKEDVEQTTTTVPTPPPVRVFLPETCDKILCGGAA